MVQPPQRTPHLVGGGQLRYYSEADACAVYRVRNGDGEIIYVGSSHDPKRRIEDEHARRLWGKEIASWSAAWHPDRATARSAELAEIERLRPKYNISGVKHQPAPIQGGEVPITAAQSVDDVLRWLRSHPPVERARLGRMLASSSTRKAFGALGDEAVYEMTRSVPWAEVARGLGVSTAAVNKAITRHRRAVADGHKVAGA